MDKILSQEEIDALMGGVMSGEVETAPKEEEDPGGVKTYSLTSQERIIRGRMPTMEMINDRFTRQQSISWSAVLREKIEFSVLGTQIMKFGDFIQKVPVPSSFNLFAMEPMRGNGLYVMDAMLVYLIVDFFFGGKVQTHVKPEGREFTTIQVRLIKKLVQQALADLEKAWQAVMPVKIGYLRSESNPQFAMVVTTSEIVVVVTLQVHLGDISREMFIAYPYSMLEPIKEKTVFRFVCRQCRAGQQLGQSFQGFLTGMRRGYDRAVGNRAYQCAGLAQFQPRRCVDARPTSRRSDAVPGRGRSEISRAARDL
jgi:flagellar motor switch protein FliM